MNVKVIPRGNDNNKGDAKVLIRRVGKACAVIISALLVSTPTLANDPARLSREALRRCNTARQLQKAKRATRAARRIAKLKASAVASVVTFVCSNSRKQANKNPSCPLALWIAILYGVGIGWIVNDVIPGDAE